MRRVSVVIWAAMVVAMLLGATVAQASPPGVTINQWVGQPDPTNAGPIKFRVVFDQPVTDFATGDVTITGSAPGTKTAAVSEVLPFDGTTYDVLVTGMTNPGSGTVIATVPAGRAHNSLGDANTASVSTDNQVTYDTIKPTASISLSVAQNNPTNTTSVSFDIVFSEPVTLATKTDTAGVVSIDLAKVIGITGTAAAAVDATKTTVIGSSNRYQVSLTLDPTKLTSPKVGTIIATVLANAGTDQAGNGSTASTGLDNTIVVDYEKPLVTINQASGQPDPTNASPILFTAAFTERVTDMKASAVTLTGATTATVTEAAPFDGTTYTISVSGISGSGDVTASIGADKVHDSAGNKNAASTSVDNTVTYKAGARSVLVSKTLAGDFNGVSAQADPTKTGPIDFTVLFSATVNGFTNTDITIGGTAGATTAVVSNPSADKKSFLVAVSGMTQAGTVIVSLAADVVTEGNLPSAGSDNVVVFDNVAPSTAISRSPSQPSLTNSKPVTFRVVFSEPVFGFTGSDVTIGGTAPGSTAASVSEVSPFDGTTYDVAVGGMSGSGTVIASVGAATVTDAAGNANTASGSATLTYDVDSPSVVVSQAATQGDPTNFSPVNFTVTFSKPVTGFTNTSVQISGTAGATTATVSGIGAVYTVAVSGMAQSGTVILTVPANAAQDGAGNGNTASTSTDNNVTYDATAPTVTVDQALTQADPVRSGPINFTVVFSEPVTGFTSSDVTISGTAGATTAVVNDSGDHRQYTVGVSGMTQSGTVSVSLASGVVQDLAGNLNKASTSTDNTVTYFSGPTVTVDQSASQLDPTSGKPINFTVVFSEPVTGFTSAGVLVTGTCPGTKLVTVTGAGANYNVAIDGMTGTGTVIVDIPANAALNNLLQGNLASTSTDNVVTYDITRPTVTIDQAPGQDDPTTASPIRYVVSFSEPVGATFVAADITVVSTAGPATVTVTDTGDHKNFTVTVTGMNKSGNITLSIPANVAQDAVGNGNFASSSTDNTVRFEVAPTVTLVQAAGQSDPTTTGPIHFTATFSKPVADFTSDDVTITGTATFSTPVITVTNSGDDMTYDVAVTGMNSSGTVVASLAAGVAHDDHGYPNTASTGADKSVTYSPVPPTVTVNQAVTQVDPTNQSPVNFTAVFSAAVTGFSSSGVTVAGTAGGSKTVTITGTGASYNIAVGGMTSSGSIRVTILANAAIDAVGNGNTASTSTDNTVTYDITAPTVTINQAATQADPASSQPIHFTAIFSKAVTFTSSGVALGGTAAPTTAVVTEIAPRNGTTFDVAVSGAAGSGTVTASVLAGGAKDSAGNDCAASTSSDNTVTLPLSVTVNQSVDQNDPTNSDTIIFTAVFSDAVTGFGNEDTNVTLSGTAGAASYIILPVDEKTYDIYVFDMTGDGTVIVDIPANAAQNSGGAQNAPSTSTDNSVLYDATPPSVVIAKAATQQDPTNNTIIQFTATFSEPVVGFTNSDVIVGGTAGATTAIVTDTGNHTLFNIAVSGMTTAGTVTAGIDSDSVTDPAGNGNLASNTDASVQFNNQVLRVTIDQAAGQADPTRNSPINFTVVFSAVVTNFGTGDVSLAGTAGATTAVVTGSGTTYTVAVSGMTQSGTVIASIPAGVANDASSNPNLASQSTDNIVTYDITRPSVTVAKAAGQADPASSTPINFTVTFSKVVTDFTSPDVTLGGTAAPTTAVVTDNGDHMSYNVAVSGMAQAGTVTVSVAANVAHDSLGNGNTAAPSAASVNCLGPSITLSLASGQADPAGGTTINLSAVFSNTVTDFTSADVTLSGTAGATTAVVTGSGTSYNIAVTGMTSAGTVIVTIPAGAAHDATGIGTTSASRTVNYDNQGPTLAITGPSTTGSVTRNVASLTLTGTASDAQGIASVSWSSLHSGVGNCTGTTSWSASIGIIGTQDTITVTAQDALGNSSTATITVHVVASSPGAAWANLAMVSLPIIPDNADPKVEVGFSVNNWASFNPDTNAYNSYPDLGTWFTPAASAIGRGFWAKFTGAVATPAGTVPDQTTEVSIHLRPGWNLIGVPFISQVTWNSTAFKVESGGVRRSLSAASDSVKNFAWGWNAVTGAYYLVTDSGASGATTTLRPWEAYWIEAVANCNLIIPAP